MLALVILLSTFLFGFSVCSFLPFKLNKAELVSIGVIIGVFFSTWIFFLASFVGGLATGVPVGLVLIESSILGLGWYRYSQKKKNETTAITHRVAYLFFMLFWAIFLWQQCSHHFFKPYDQTWDSSGSSWGDLALHSTFVTYFAQQDQLQLHSPVYVEQQLTYPFLFDFFTAVIFKTGVSLRTSLLITSFPVMVAVVSLLYFFSIRLTKNPWLAWVGPLLFFLNSNVGFIYFLTDWLHSQQSLLNFLHKIPQNYVHYAEKGLDWPQFLFDYFFPQRGIVMGFGIFLTIFFTVMLLFERAEEKKNKWDIPPFLLFFLACCIGLLPLFHVHTFLVVLGVLTWFSIIGLKTQKITWKQITLPLGVICILAAPQLLLQFGLTYHSGFSRIQFGWLMQAHPSTLPLPLKFIWFWLQNLGFELILALAGCFVLFRMQPTSWFLKIFVTPLLILFLIGNVIVFQPNDWDNSKFFFYSHLAFVLLILWIFDHLTHAKKLGKLIFVIYVLLLTIGGVLATVRENEIHYPLANADDLKIAELIKEQTPAGAIFLTGANHNSPVTMLAGRPTVLGYRGWLWSYGINYGEVEQAVKKIYTGDEAAISLLKQYHVQYIYLGITERTEFNADEKFFSQHFPLLIQTRVAKVYSAEPLPSIPEPRAGE